MKIGLDLRMIAPIPTGVGVYLREMSRALIRMDKTHSYIIIHSDKHMLEELQKMFGAYPNVSFALVRTKANAPWQYLLLPFDIPKVDLWITDIWGCTPRLPVPYFLILMDLFSYHYPSIASFRIRAFNACFMRTIVNHAQRIFTLSLQGKEDIEHYLHQGEKTEVVYAGVSEEFAAPIKKEDIVLVQKQYKIEAPYFIYIGNVRKHKNLPFLIDAFSQFRSQYNQRVQLIIAGNVDSKSTRKNLPILLQQIADSPYKEDIIRTGHISRLDYIKLVKGSIGLVHPSFFEGFGMTPLEAMKAGKPVICSNASKMEDMFKGGGIFADPTDTGAWIDAMQTLVSDPLLAQQLGETGSKISATFTWDRTARIVLDSMDAFFNTKSP